MPQEALEGLVRGDGEGRLVRANELVQLLGKFVKDAAGIGVESRLRDNFMVVRVATQAGAQVGIPGGRITMKGSLIFFLIYSARWPCER